MHRQVPMYVRISRASKMPKELHLCKNKNRIMRAILKMLAGAERAVYLM
ncbi:MAG: hypothetical protein IJB87_08650 [Alistipes sp.]|nr:hypothetical protein [Alistipes sp.]